MLHLVIPEREYFDDEKQEFISIPEQSLNLEHSLVSISKWESKWQKPFLGEKERTYEEFVDYIKCMTLDENVNEETYSHLTKQEIDQVLKYVDDKMTATWFNEHDQKKGGRGGQAITSELVYYWMVAFQIPFTCETWHFNRLLTLIRICEVKNQPSKKMKKKDILKSNAALNEARRNKFGSRG